jgi:hypothetical protein
MQRRSSRLKLPILILMALTLGSFGKFVHADSISANENIDEAVDFIDEPEHNDTPLADPANDPSLSEEVDEASGDSNIGASEPTPEPRNAKINKAKAKKRKIVHHAKSKKNRKMLAKAKSRSHSKGRSIIR